MIKKILKRIIHPSTRRFLRDLQASIFKCAQTFHRKASRGLPGRFLDQKGLLLNIGCGKLIRPGWLNVDIDPGNGAYFLDLEKGLPFRDGRIRHIHCEHVLEHLDYPVSIRFLKECHRVLEPQGTIRIILPDAEIYFRAYCDNDIAFFDKLKNLGGATVAFRTPVETINQMFRMGGDHKYAWDFQTLKMNLQDAGFADVRRSKPDDMSGELSIDGTDSWRVMESLYVNATRSGTLPG